MQYMEPEELQWFLAEATSLADTKRIVAEVLRRRHSVGTSLRRQALTFAYYLFSSDLNPPVR
ncbi:unnamed protein product [Arabis nemorensis]|uniref:Uncharacterized protein n=1 Tax=Arabis nemorensis TaxID=586526 RepID=A0A565CS08_9BRAS|nr:unnamed protein product [Arabis nemorensis]